MKNLGFLVALVLSASSYGASKFEQIGEEVIIPSEYPKFSLFGKYNSFRHGSIRGQDIQTDLSSFFGGGAYIDVPLYDNFSAGAILNFDINANAKEFDSIVARFSMFARPKISFFDCLTIFSRLGFGPSVFIGLPHDIIMEHASTDVVNRMQGTYNARINQAALKYSPINPGVHGLATIGLEYFPTSRLGLSLEWGIWADYIFVSESKIVGGYIERNLHEDRHPDPYNYLVYEMPFILSLNIIL